MMSESDDTDVLLLIPPDLFLVPSSEDSDDSEFPKERLGYRLQGGRPSTSVVTELFDQVQSLENRISVIESKDTSLDTSFLNNSSDTQFRTTNFSSPSRANQVSVRNNFGSVSHISNLENTPAKPRKYSSAPTTPSNYHLRSHTNQNCCDMKSLQFAALNSHTNAYKYSNTNLQSRTKHNDSMSYSEPSIIHHSSSSDIRNMGIPHASSAISCKKETYIDNNEMNKSNLQNKPSERISFSLPLANSNLKPTGKRFEQRSVKDMELSEVDELLHEMEITEAELAKRIKNGSSYQSHRGNAHQMNFHTEDEKELREVNALHSDLSPVRRLDFNFHNEDLYDLPNISSDVQQRSTADKYLEFSLPFDEDSLHLDVTDKIISEFKTWRQNCGQTQKDDQGNDDGKNGKTLHEESKKHAHVQSNPSSNINTIDRNPAAIQTGPSRIIVNSDNPHSHESSSHADPNSTPMLHTNFLKAHIPINFTQLESNATQLAEVPRHSYSTSNLLGCTSNNIHDIPNHGVSNKITNDAATNTESLRKSHRLLTLSDFWETDPTKSQEDMLRIKLEEEKFRRDHCEHLIQELQKRLLEQQEKVAVAVRVDNEKNVIITKFQNAWTKLKLRWQVLEAESNDLHLTLKNMKDKHQMEYTELQTQIKRCEGELSKALDLAAGYKEKSDTMTKENLELLKSHADELENYKALVQEAENRYSQLKVEYDKLSDQSQQLGEALKNTQQEVNRERLRGGEVRGEMGVIHKALDACEAELIVLRQEKENLQLKLKEEISRNHILEQNKSTLLTAIEEAKCAERKANEESKSFAAQEEKTRKELRDVYQKQVDEVVKAKLQEFQSQLDTAESTFQSELESRQRAIAECAARKIKTVLDKHQLEINLLEEKHKEEKRLHQIQLAQAMQQISILDSKLNTQHTNKTQLAEQLHSVMQRQWQQALQIISGGNMDNLTPIQRIHAEKFFESRHSMKSESSPNIGCNVMEPIRLESHSMPLIEMKNFPSTLTRAPEEKDGNSMLTNPGEGTPLTSHRDQSKDDLRRYIKMILDMQQPKSNFVQPPYTESSQSPVPICREVPRKHYMRKEESFMSEDSSVIWQPSSEVSPQDVTEYISVPQKLPVKSDQQKNKPPWK
ncbi:sporulation-specific protein 15-like [Athalia rosae]|uniref:sporulation-specific protein 15-like n=1 Tax=Athalia rosae TaxID=37344 RepID=UPI0020344AC0|nr:sporulation-specific protein 15-like [Athalia rosae]